MGIPEVLKSNKGREQREGFFKRKLLHSRGTGGREV